MKYEFKYKNLDVESGGKNILVMNKEDAIDLNLNIMDRVEVKDHSKSQIALVELSESTIKRGEVGLFKELSSRLRLKPRQKVTIEPVPKPISTDYIKKKMDGGFLSEEEIREIIKGVMDEELSDAELAAFITAMYIRGLSNDETLYLTKAIVDSGSTLKINKKIILDKHCIGGVPGNRTTMLIVPILAAAGVIIPKTSSRAITSPAGTADTMEVLAPVSLPVSKIKKVVEKTNGCMVWGGGVNLAAADDKLIKIRHPLKMDPRGVLLASILAKKKAVGATHVLIDIPVGVGSKILNYKEAESLAKDFMDLGSKLDMNVHCITTPGYDPIGFAIGPKLEAREIMRILYGQKVSLDLIDKSLVMAGLMLEMAGVAKQGEGKKMAQEILEDGRALKKMKEIIKAQGGNPNIKPEDIKPGKYSLDIFIKEDGRIHLIHNNLISEIARIAGAPNDKGAGIYMYFEKGDKVKKGQKLMTIYAESERKLKAAKEFFQKHNVVEMDKVILENFSTETKPIVYEFGK